MQAIEYAAYVSVGRGCGFAGLAVFCVMLGLSFEPVLATKTGGLLCLGVTAILLIRAFSARKRPYKRTELWLILPKAERPPEAIAQKVIGGALHDTYLVFAEKGAVFAIGLLAVSVLLAIALRAPPL